MVVDAAVHPREKLCGGGVTQHGMEVLQRLDLNLAVAHVPVRELRLKLGGRTYAVRDTPLFNIVRRDEFDHWLVQCARHRGVLVREGERVETLRSGDAGVEVTTSRGTIRARAVVVADGSPSFVRQQLGWPGSGQAARLLEVLTSEPEGENAAAFRDGVAVFEFDPVPLGLQGYYWDFPCRVRGRATMSRGMYDSRIHQGEPAPKLSMKQMLSRSLAERGQDLDGCELKGHTLRSFDSKAEFSRPRFLLVGDAAGVDPLFGEGIGYALAYGDATAAELCHAFQRDDLGFAGYRGRVLSHPTLRHLVRRRRLARLVYALHRRPWLGSAAWRMVPWYFRWLAWRDSQAIPMSLPAICRTMQKSGLTACMQKR